MPLKELLEHVVLNPDQLTQLKLKIKQHSIGELSSFEFKQYFLQQQIEIVEDLLLLFPVYAKRMGNSETTPQERNHTGNNGEVGRLKQQLQERDELLKDLVPRIMHLEQKVGISSKSVQNILPKDPELNPETEITNALEMMNINNWLSVFDINTEGQIIRNDYRFIPQFISSLINYHDNLFNSEKEKATNLEKIEHLDLPRELKDALINILAIRNNLSHDIYTLSSNEVEVSYTTYFQLLFYLFSHKINQTVFDTHKEHIHQALTGFITDKFTNEPLIASYACNVIKNI